MDLFDELLFIYRLVIIQFRLVFPYWLSGVIAGSLLSVFASARIKLAVSRLRDERYSFSASLVAAVLGVLSPICMYGTIPLIASLGKNKVPQYILAAFMVSSILLNPNLLLFSFVLGTPLAIARLVCCVAAGLLAGFLVKVFFRNRDIFCFENFGDKKKSIEKKPDAIVFLKDLNKAVTITAPYLFIGILLTALFERYVPKALIIGLFGDNKGFGILLAASLGVPIYVCGGGTIPMIRSWLEAGMSPGSAIAFMISGPATKLTNLSAVKIILGVRNFMLYIGFNIGFSILSGIIVDMVYGLVKGYGG